MDTSRGLRLLRQDPEETLFAFITSANNNITRITKLLRKLCIAYGNPLYLENGDVTNWTFPSLEILAQPGMHDNLKKIGFGYRSKFIECVNYSLEAVIFMRSWILYSIVNFYLSCCFPISIAISQCPNFISSQAIGFINQN
ncbi:N-glycosylase/DNA lyase [Schistosoma japonicum]|nr:N-glycosylase/DNA lyase [Schistosoma japonicum]